MNIFDLIDETLEELERIKKINEEEQILINDLFEKMIKFRMSNNEHDCHRDVFGQDSCPICDK